jgi:ribA/ribD-fused uncharacterized protein
MLTTHHFSSTLSAVYDLRLSQAAKFNQDKGAQIRKWIQEADEPQEAKRLGSEYFREPFRASGFFDGDRNIEIMFHITLAKFQQNPKLRRWLLDTDRAVADIPILHTMERDSFWGVGALQEDGMYRGKNWNGKILMLVRRLVGDEEGVAGRVQTDTLGPTARLARNPFPPLDPRVTDDAGAAEAELCRAMEQAATKLRDTLELFGEPPAPEVRHRDPTVQVERRMPRGALIAQRYKVVDHAFTGLARSTPPLPLPLPRPLPPPALPKLSFVNLFVGSAGASAGGSRFGCMRLQASARAWFRVCAWRLRTAAAARPPRVASP